jgi:uncharacterized protein (TIGR01319 family)
MKRTVEGDLGVYVNRYKVLSTLKDEDIKRIFELSLSEVKRVLDEEPFIPQTEKGKMIIDKLTERCVELALDRHVGDLKRVFTTNGYKVIPDGKDTTQVKAIFLTGGALLYANHPDDIIKKYLSHKKTKLIPDEQTPIYIDTNYIFASLGVLSRIYPEETKALIDDSIKKVGSTSCTPN